MVDAGRFSLCEMCAERQGGEADFDLAEGDGCFICQGLTSRLESTERKVAREASRYQFDTFSIGMILPAGVQEREDRLRSELRIRGRATIKSQLSGKIASFVQSKSDKKVDRLHPGPDSGRGPGVGHGQPDCEIDLRLRKVLKASGHLTEEGRLRTM